MFVVVDAVDDQCVAVVIMLLRCHHHLVLSVHHVVAAVQRLHTFNLLTLIDVLMIDLLNGMGCSLCLCQLVVDVCAAVGWNTRRACGVVVVGGCRGIVEVDDGVVCVWMALLNA